MSTNLLVSCLLLGFAGAAPNRQQTPASKTCFDKAGPQLAMNHCAAADADAAESELNHTYQEILKKYTDQPLFIQRLREAQQAWLRFRDAQIAMRFPVAAQGNPSAAYGSVYPMCHGIYKAELTRRRTKELQEWLTGSPEGESCSGSVKTSSPLK